MKREEVVELLFNYGKHEDYLKAISLEMDALKEEIEHYRELTAVQYTGMPKTGGASDPTGEAASYIKDKLEGRLKKLKVNVDEIIKQKEFVEELLNRLTIDERKVIEERYIKGTRWDLIPKILHFERSWCFALRKKAIKKMCKTERVD